MAHACFYRAAELGRHVSPDFITSAVPNRWDTQTGGYALTGFTPGYPVAAPLVLPGIPSLADIKALGPCHQDGRDRESMPAMTRRFYGCVGLSVRSETVSSNSSRMLWIFGLRFSTMIAI